MCAFTGFISSVSFDLALLLTCTQLSRGAARLKLPAAAREQVVRAGCLASRGSRAHKRNTSKSGAAATASRDDGGERRGATEPAAAAADGAGSS